MAGGSDRPCYLGLQLFGAIVELCERKYECCCEFERQRKLELFERSCPS